MSNFGSECVRISVLSVCFTYALVRACLCVCLRVFSCELNYSSLFVCLIEYACSLVCAYVAVFVLGFALCMFAFERCIAFV
jgi:hypothetical protein